MANKFIDLTGQKFNRLTVIRYVGKSKLGVSIWECLCDCGNIKVIDSGNLKKKKNPTCSCGCLKIENALRTIKINGDSTTHGKSRESVYMSWQAMKKRCTNKKDKYYHIYGGRGIKVCDRWLESFENFFEDMGEKTTPKHTLDRFPDKNGDYKPGNCRWATQKEQQNNRTNNNIIKYNGLSLTLSQWSERVGIKSSTIRERIAKHKWSIEKALTY